jgi:flagellar hook-associated protein 2
MAVDYLQALGAGAGIDTKSIVESLVEAERIPQQQSLDRLKERSDLRLSSFGIVKSTLEAVRDQFRKLDDVSDIKAFSATSSDTDTVNVSATSSAGSGTYDVTVSILADRDSFSYDGFDSLTDSLNGGASVDIDITKGGITSTVTIASPTLTSVVDAINDADLGVTASIIDTGAASKRYVLSLSGETGADNSFTVSASVLTGEVQRTTARDSKFSVNGVDVVSDSNTVSTAIQGVTLNLETLGNATVTVATNTDKVKEEIRTLVEVYNEMRSIFGTLRGGTDPDNELAGALATDSVFRTIESTFRNKFSSQSSTPTDDINYWADMGVSVQRDGSLTLDEDRLDSALKNSFDDVVTALTADTENQTDLGTANRGLAGDMSALIRELNSIDGPVSYAIQSAEQGLSKYEERLADLEDRMARIQARYTEQFAAMQKIVDSFNATGEYLANNLAAMNNND